MKPDTQARVAFWNANHAVAMMSLASLPNHEGMVIVVADLRDTIGRSIAEGLAEKGQLPEHEAKVLKKKEIPTAIMIMPAAVVARVLKVPNPAISDVLRKGTPAAGNLFVVVIGSGGSTLLQTPDAPVGAAGSG
jgi:hypothetical protein